MKKYSYSKIFMKLFGQNWIFSQFFNEITRVSGLFLKCKISKIWSHLAYFGTYKIVNPEFELKVIWCSKSYHFSAYMVQNVIKFFGKKFFIRPTNPEKSYMKHDFFYLGLIWDPSDAQMSVYSYSAVAQFNDVHFSRISSW